MTKEGYSLPPIVTDPIEYVGFVVQGKRNKLDRGRYPQRRKVLPRSAIPEAVPSHVVRFRMELFNRSATNPDNVKNKVLGAGTAA